MGTIDRERLTSRDGEELYSEERRIAEMAHSLRRTQGLGELARSLKALRATLETHFAGEEAPDGFFDMIRDRAALYVAPVEQLRREHILLLRDADLILDRVRECLAGPVAEVMLQARALGERIARHEARESALLGDAMHTDVGAGDGG